MTWESQPLLSAKNLHVCACMQMSICACLCVYWWDCVLMCVPAEGAVHAHVTVSALHDHLALTVRLDAEPTVNSLAASIHIASRWQKKGPWTDATFVPLTTDRGKDIFGHLLSSNGTTQRSRLQNHKYRWLMTRWWRRRVTLTLLWQPACWPDCVSASGCGEKKANG